MIVFDTWIRNSNSNACSWAFSSVPQSRDQSWNLSVHARDSSIEVRDCISAQVLNGSSPSPRCQCLGPSPLRLSRGPWYPPESIKARLEILALAPMSIKVEPEISVFGLESIKAGIETPKSCLSPWHSGQGPSRLKPGPKCIYPVSRLSMRRSLAIK